MSIPIRLPDPELTLRDARDFVFNTQLARKAAGTAWPRFHIALRDLLDAIYRLVQSCHMPEFTDHGLPHICSLIDRICRWGCPDGQDLPDHLDEDLAAVLLVAALVHDIGMLSQKAEDLPPDAPISLSKAQWTDVSAWVRRTHVPRLPRLLQRLMLEAGHDAFVSDARFARAVDVATGHEKWPWQWQGDWQETPEYRALAAVIAVADLLDEDAARCDTLTLIRHRDGSLLNTAHWLRHALTQGRIMVEAGRIAVQMIKPPSCSSDLAPVFGALRNHFRLVALYSRDLQAIKAQITNLTLSPCTGLPEQEGSHLSEWQSLSGFATERAMCFQLLNTFLPEALKDERRLSQDDLQRIKAASLEDVDLSLLERIQGSSEPRTNDEQAFLALVD